MAACVAVLAAGACYESMKSRGGGQTSKENVAKARSGPPNPYDVELPPGYAIEVVADKLDFPTGIAFGEGGRIYVVESGYSYGEVFTKPRLLEITNGQKREIASGDGAPWNGVAYHAGALYVAHGGQLTGGRIVRYDLDGNATVLADHLPSQGDHHTNGPVVTRDGWVYFGQGTVTNSGVVGKDNAEFGWLERHPELHDTPCDDITLNGYTFDGTGAYHALGTAGERGELIKGHVPCNGAVMRVRASGGPVELVAWGFRNPFGLALRREQLYVTDNAFDVRGSRPVFGVADTLWKVDRGRWYGWPD
jgi:glucose/arabinose dehydrogenase